MNVLVTGANGLLATNIIVQLLAQDYHVKGLIRDPRKFLLSPHKNLQLVLAISRIAPVYPMPLKTVITLSIARPLPARIYRDITITTLST